MAIDVDVHPHIVHNDKSGAACGKTQKAPQAEIPCEFNVAIQYFYVFFRVSVMTTDRTVTSRFHGRKNRMS